MKKKLALLMAAIMTVAMVPMTAFAAASTKVIAVDQIKVAAEDVFTSRVELKKDENAVDAESSFEVRVTLENAKFTKVEDGNGDEVYEMDDPAYLVDGKTKSYIPEFDVINDTTAVMKVAKAGFNGTGAWIALKAQALEVGDVVVKFSTNKTIFADCSEVIATVVDGDVVIESAGVVTFVEDSKDDIKALKNISIKSLYNGVIDNNTVIELRLKGDFEFNTKAFAGSKALANVAGDTVTMTSLVDFLNDNGVVVGWEAGCVSDDEITLKFAGITANQAVDMILQNLYVTPTSKCDVGDVATLVISSDDFDTVKLEVAKMVAEAVTYTVEDDELPVIWAGAANEDANTLEVSVEENTGDILNTSRKATFTFPEGIEVAGFTFDSAKSGNDSFEYKIDENVVTIWNYSRNAESDITDFDIEFVLNADPTFTGDVDVVLGGEFDDVTFTVATVKAPYTVEAKTSEVLIDYRYVPVNEIVITEAEDGILEEGDQIVLAVEKMEFEDAGDYEVTEGDIEVDVDIFEDGFLTIVVEEDSTEASTIVISGLELYLDRTLPVGGYELVEVKGGEVDEQGNVIYNNTILWDNVDATKAVVAKSSTAMGANGVAKHVADADVRTLAMFKVEEIVVNDEYVEVVTQARDQDDYSTSKKIVITIGAPTMTVGTQVINLVTPAYINAENFTELPVRAISEAFGADVLWDAATKTVTVMMGQRIVSMTIGGRTMYINGTPVAMSTAPEITNDFTFVPVRDLANALGISKIDWNAEAATVTLN